MLKKLLITALLANTLVDLYRLEFLNIALPNISIVLALCIAIFYLFNHLIVRIYLDSHENEVQED
jgi:hypothetical protein